METRLKKEREFELYEAYLIANNFEYMGRIYDKVRIDLFQRSEHGIWRYRDAEYKKMINNYNPKNIHASDQREAVNALFLWEEIEKMLPYFTELEKELDYEYSFEYTKVQLPLNEKAQGLSVLIEADEGSNLIWFYCFEDYPNDLPPICGYYHWYRCTSKPNYKALVENIVGQITDLLSDDEIKSLHEAFSSGEKKQKKFLVKERIFRKDWLKENEW